MSNIEAENVLIAQRIRWWRLGSKLSQQVVADRAGIDRTYLSKIESGAARLDSRSTLERIARALGVSYNDLTGQPIKPTTPELQAAHGAVERIRVAHVALDNDSPPAAMRPLEQLTGDVQAAAQAWQDCDYAAAGRDLGRIITDLHAHVHTGNRAGLPIYVEALDVAAWTVRLLGHYDLAYALTSRQQAIAADSDDQHLQAFSAFTRALTIGAAASGDEQAQATGRRHAERALDALTPRDDTGLQLAGMLHLAACRADIGSGGDGAEHLAEATRLAERTGDGTAYQLFFGPTNVAIWKIHFAVERGDGGATVELARDVRLDAIGSKARQTMFYRHLGLGLAQSRGREAAAIDALLKAERLAPGKLRLDPLARETVGHLLSRARATAGGEPLRRLARHVGIL